MAGVRPTGRGSWSFVDGSPASHDRGGAEEGVNCWKRNRCDPIWIHLWGTKIRSITKQPSRRRGGAPNQRRFDHATAPRGRY
jgi:hypothetical protein